MVEGDNFAVPTENKPSTIRRQSVREAQEEQERAAATGPPAQTEPRQSPPPGEETKQSPKPDFDINKVFSSVRSPTAGHQRRPSQPPPLAPAAGGPAGGPGVGPGGSTGCCRTTGRSRRRTRRRRRRTRTWCGAGPWS